MDHVIARAVEKNSGLAVAGEHIAGAGNHAADDVARPVLDGDAIACVGNARGALEIRADIIAPNDVGRRSCAIDIDAARAVAGYEVARAGHDAANDVARGTGQRDTVVGVGQGGGAGRGGAYEVALNGITRRIEQVDARVAVAGNHVAIGGIRAANDVARRTIEPNPLQPIAAGGRARELHADKISGDGICAGPLHQNRLCRKAVQGQGANGSVARQKSQPGIVAGPGPVDFHQRAARKSLLGGSVNRHRIGDRGQSGQRHD